MRSKSFVGMVCPIAGALEAVGDRWAFLILRDLGLGPARYDDLKTSTNMPNSTLSGRLRHLEKYGLVERSPYQEHPPRSEYRLTAKGRDFWMVSFALGRWGERWDASGAGAPSLIMVDGATGRPVKLMLVDADTETPVPPQRLRALPGPAADDFTRERLTRLAATPETPNARH